MKHKGYGCLLSDKEYLKIILANIINRFGDSIDEIAFAWVIYAITGSAAWSGILFGVNMIPTVILQPLCGGIVEHLKKKNVMIWCDIFRGLIVCGIAVLYILKILTPFLLLSTTFIISCLEAFRVPAGIAIVPKLLSKEHYDYGTSLNSSLSQLCSIIGAGVAGGIIGLFGVQAAILTDAFTFFMSGLIILLVKYDDKVSKGKVNFTTYFQTMKSGFTYLKTSKVLILLCALGALSNFLLCPFNSFLTPYIVDTLGATSSQLSIIVVSLSIGIMIGSFCYPFISKVVGYRLQITVSFIGCAFVYFVLAFVPLIQISTILNVIIASFAMCLFGFFIGIASTCFGILLMKKTDQSYMARVSAVFNSSVCVVLPATSFILSGIAVSVSTVWIFVITGVVSIILTFVISLLKQMKLLCVEEKENENSIDKTVQLS